MQFIFYLKLIQNSLYRLDNINISSRDDIICNILTVQSVLLLQKFKEFLINSYIKGWY